MSTAAPSSAGVSLLPRTTVGAKFAVAITGLGLVGFVLAHLLGNLQLFLGREALNSYAEALKSKPALLWPARIGLLALFVTHILLALRLKRRNLAARPTPYAYQHTEEASFASRTMVWSGLALLFFVLYHLAHYTLFLTNPSFKELKDASGRADVYGMVIEGFSNPLATGLYVVAMLCLGLHLSHGVASLFQSLGVRSPTWEPRIKRLGLGLTLLVVVGNILMPLAVLLGLVH